MGRTRDVSKILTSNTSILSLASASSTYQTKASAGLNLVNATSFTAQTTVSINNVFSATYRNYKIIIRGTGPSDTLNFRLRVSGADATGSEYWYGFMWLAFNAAVMQNPTVAENATSCKVGEFGGSANAFTVDITGPFLAATTAMNMHNSFSRGTSAGQARTFVGGCFHDLATSYDGFTFYCDSGTITGTVSVYGYNE
jgi:hypothetical protein